MGGIGGAIDNALIAFAFFAFSAGVSLALFFIYVVPWLWQLAKPLLHALTA